MSKFSLKLTFGEEVANAVSHAIASLLVLLGIPLISIVAYTKGNLVDVVCVNIFCISIFMMFLSSTLYHSMAHDTKHKEIFHILDHVFIYVAIAGSYTPLAMSVIGGWQGITLLSIQWVMVLFGILYKALAKHKMPKASLMIYIVMGWSIVFFMPRFINKANPFLFWLIFAGGVLYSMGAFFYAKKGFKYHHMVWHIFVLLAALTHFVGICFFLY